MSRFSSIFNNAGTKALIAGDDGIFINGGYVTIADGLPVGFRFALRTTSAGGFNIACDNDVIFDDAGDQSNTYGNAGINKGEYAEFIKTSSFIWTVLQKQGVWAAT